MIPPKELKLRKSNNHFEQDAKSSASISTTEVLTIKQITTSLQSLEYNEFPPPHPHHFTLTAAEFHQKVFPH